jgi:hypothetical protein
VKSFFNVPRGKLSPRALAAEAEQSRGCQRISVYTTFFVQPKICNFYLKFLFLTTRLYQELFFFSGRIARIIPLRARLTDKFLFVPGTGPFFDPPLVGGGVGGVIHHRAKHGKAAHVLFRFAFNLMRCIAK